MYTSPYVTNTILKNIFTMGNIVKCIHNPTSLHKLLLFPSKRKLRDHASYTLVGE